MKIAILGTGRMGRRHIQVAQSMNLEIVGICDSSKESLALANQENNISPDISYVDAATMLDKTMPDCVIIATTAPTHCDYTCMAAERGVKFILCEKPLATSLADCDKMLETCARYGALLAVNHQMRFMDQYTIPKKLLISEEFGGLSSISVIAGNFGMAMNGTHYFEMLRYMTDDDPVEVSAWFSSDDVPNPRGPEFVDKAGTVRVTTKSGKRFYMDISSDQGHGMLAVYASRNGRIVVDELTGEMKTVVREAEHRSLPTTRYGMPFIENVTKISPADAIAPSKAVLQALLSNKDYPDGEDGRKAVEVLVAAYISAESGNRAVSLRQEQLPAGRKFPWA